MGSYTYPKFVYKPPTDLMTTPPQRRPLVIVGAGPVGLAAAVDARLQGLEVLLFDEDDSVSVGSRAVCCCKKLTPAPPRWPLSWPRTRLASPLPARERAGRRLPLLAA